ncbi:MAG: hypothetical protein NTW65_06335 [Deltaproteobacteria bacterium]|nr:hypothetical protein [Deltaproteobacteria bacterium]
MRKRLILSLTLAVIFCSASLITMAVAAEKTKTAQTKSQVQTNKPAAQSANSITQDAVKNGVRTCAARMNQVTNFLTAGAKDVGYMMFFSKNNPDQQMTSVSMEIPLKEASSAYASASVVPGQANYCGGMYETVAYWPQKCAEVAEKQFGKFKKAGALSKNIGVRDGGSTKVFLMPAGTGCVSIKKEIVR